MPHCRSRFWRLPPEAATVAPITFSSACRASPKAFGEKSSHSTELKTSPDQLCDEAVAQSDNHSGDGLALIGSGMTINDKHIGVDKRSISAHVIYLCPQAMPRVQSKRACPAGLID